MGFKFVYVEFRCNCRPKSVERHSSIMALCILWQVYDNWSDEFRWHSTNYIHKRLITMTEGSLKGHNFVASISSSVKFLSHEMINSCKERQFVVLILRLFSRESNTLVLSLVDSSI